MGDYFVKIKAVDNNGDDFVTYRIISAQALGGMLKTFANLEYPYEWRVGTKRFITWEYPHSFKESLYTQDLTNEESLLLASVFNFNEFPWPTGDKYD